MKNTVKTLFTALMKSRKSQKKEFLFSRLQHHFIKHSEQTALRRAKAVREFVKSSLSAQAIRRGVLASSTL
jgi:hypothetical protein